MSASPIAGILTVLETAIFMATWAKCNIAANIVIEETANIIAKAFNASAQLSAGQYYNAYDAIFITLLEGSDASFNIPFLVTNAYSDESTNPAKALFKTSLGPVLGLNHHIDTTLDQLLYDGQAKPNVASANVASELAPRTYRRTRSWEHSTTFPIRSSLQRNLLVSEC